MDWYCVNCYNFKLTPISSEKFGNLFHQLEILDTFSHFCRIWYFYKRNSDSGNCRYSYDRVMARIWGITSLDKLEFESRHLSTAAIPNFSAVQHNAFLLRLCYARKHREFRLHWQPEDIKARHDVSRCKC